MVAVIQIVYYAFQAYFLLLFARIIASWVPELNRYRAMQLVAQCTDPYLNVFRRVIPPLGMIDFSPMVAFFCLFLLQNFLIQLLIGFVR